VTTRRVDDSIDPSRVSTPAELSRAMTALKQHAGLSDRKIADRAATGAGIDATASRIAPVVALPRSTLSLILTERKFPTKEQLITFVRICAESDEESLDEWEAAWTRAETEHRRYGAVGSATQIPPVSTLLEAGPKGSSLMILRRSISEAAEEMSKVSPGTAARVLSRWPLEIGAGILAAMEPRTATAVLLTLRPGWRYWIPPFSSGRMTAVNILSTMTPAAAAACLEMMDPEKAATLLVRMREQKSILESTSDNRIRRAIRFHYFWLGSRSFLIGYALLLLAVVYEAIAGKRHRPN
jgi:hypothetical protein